MEDRIGMLKSVLKILKCVIIIISDYATIQHQTYQ